MALAPRRTGRNCRRFDQCQRKAHPVYGDLCEDCWVLANCPPEPPLPRPKRLTHRLIWRDHGAVEEEKNHEAKEPDPESFDSFIEQPQPEGR